MYRFKVILGVLCLTATSLLLTDHAAKSKTISTTDIQAAVISPKFVQQSYTKYQQSYFTPAKANQLFVNSSDSTKTKIALSEAQGYGMYATVKARNGKQVVFNKLYNYYMAHRDKNTNLMAWKQNVTSGTNYENNATDGDLYIAESLLLAGNRWHNIKYQKQAVVLLNDILKFNYNSKTKVLTVGNWATSGKSYYLIRTSDIIPSFFADFHKSTHNSLWQTISKNELAALSQTSNATKNGIIPDLILYQNGKATTPTINPLDTGSDNIYSYNACRVPLNLAMTNNKLAQAVNHKFVAFLNKQHPLYAGYNINGKIQARYTSPAFILPVEAANHNVNKADATIGGKQYYSDSQRMLAQFVSTPK